MRDKKLKLFQLNRVCAGREGVRRLIRGQFDTGWLLYDQHHYGTWFDKRFVNLPYWKYENIKGKRLLLMYEQGIGEQIYFAAVIPELVAMGAEVILEVDERLVTIMQRSFPEITVIAYSFPPNELCYTADYHCFISTAYGYLRPTFESHNVKAYLKADPTIARDIYPADIGLSWYSSADRYNAAKNVPYGLLKPIIENGKKSVISVQYGRVFEEGINKPTFNITQNLENFAALLTKCSKVITISNVAAHMAGALGVETHIMVPNAATGRHFYWYPERETVPNYSSASAYLQMPPGNWKPLIEYLTKKVVDI